MPAAKPTRVVAYLKTDVGVVREHNEDAAYVDPAGTYFLVADGMGGHAAGEVASAMAVDEVRSALEDARPIIEDFVRHPDDDGRRRIVKTLEEAVRTAHRAVFERGGRESDKRGMGTTLDVVLVADGEAFVAHVGDSRTYLLRNGALASVTTDHTVAEVLVLEGKLTAEEARLSPLRTILVNAIGVAPEVGVELAHLRLRRDDKLLLCSDGLHDYFPVDAELGELLTEKGGEEGLERLVNLARERGGHDNITGVLVEVVEGPATVQEEEDEARRNAEALQAGQSAEDQAAVPSQIEPESTPPLTGEEAAADEKPAEDGAVTTSDKTQPLSLAKPEAEPATSEKTKPPEGGEKPG